MQISLIVPCYNEEVNIQKGVLDKIGNYTQNDQRFSEVIIVDDGSSDSSKAVIENKYLKSYPKFHLIQNSHQGKAFAVLTGIKQAKADYIIFTDIDLATPIDEVEKLIAKTKEGGQIVIGSRNNSRAGAPLLRKIMAKGFIFIRNIIIGLKGIKDTQCGFKLFEKRAALEIIDKLQVFHNNRIAKDSSVSAGFDIEFLFLGQKLGYKIVEVPVVWRHVETKNVNFIRDTIETLRDIFKIKLLDLQGKYR
ncbi:MAG: Glycosyl transferase, family 2 [Candidatus Roizmanbacteria bacterium GW2011_GWA2_33_33]|uniref:Glycosyl transferase, family 2 n=2 Tax=Candidatus Roizmaniibacteriota TaxID=1752723 RepID=A0A0G0BHV1_9BACT|nr:MAG: Glycosyl transferase, family 2 [Candidatus Roizmanbacteria bacterium GW2011_GWA2_33_33]KKP63206.1 MAG: Glycosyl transferase, family 2 [Candidatus Roizmanbacteria bacterium GW2011_GWC2_34_23]